MTNGCVGALPHDSAGHPGDSRDPVRARANRRLLVLLSSIAIVATLAMLAAQLAPSRLLRNQCATPARRDRLSPAAGRSLTSYSAPSCSATAGTRSRIWLNGVSIEITATEHSPPDVRANGQHPCGQPAGGNFGARNASRINS